MIVALALIDVLSLIGIAAVCGGVAYLGYRIEPHWVSKDGKRFLTLAQELDQFSTPIGRRREVRVRVNADDKFLEVSRRSLMKPASGLWQVVAKSPTPPKKRAVYVLKLVTGTSLGGDRGVAAQFTQMALRLPADSKMIPVLDAMLSEDPAV